MQCDHCGGTHENVPVEQLTTLDGEYGAACPHCGNFHEMDVDDPDDLETHPAVPDDEPATCVCRECNGSFRVKA